MTDLAKQILNILYIAGEEVSLSKIAEALDRREGEIVDEIVKLENHVHGLGLKIIRKDKYLMISSHPDHSTILENFAKKETDSELSPAVLQAVTIVAYMPGATAQEVSFVRGVESSKSLRNLQTRGLLEKRENKYHLTFDSLKHLGISKIEDLPDFANINKNLIEKLNQALNE